MTISPRAIALNGIGFPPLVLAAFGFMGVQPPEVARPAGRVVGQHDRPWKFFDQPKRRPRKKRQQDILFLGQ